MWGKNFGLFSVEIILKQLTEGPKNVQNMVQGKREEGEGGGRFLHFDSCELLGHFYFP